MDFVLKEEHGYSYIDEGEGEVLLLLHGLMGVENGLLSGVNILPNELDSLTSGISLKYSK